MKTKDNVEKWEKEAAIIIQDFTLFCDYLLKNGAKLSKNTGYIGKKDCFEINALLHVKEEYERATRFQNQYPIINYFYYVAIKYRILKLVSSGSNMSMGQGEHYELYQQASVLERYILFLLVFIFDGSFVRETFLWKVDMERFLTWLAKEKPSTDVSYEIPSIILRNLIWCTDGIEPYLEELSLAKVLKRADDTADSEQNSWEIKALPLLGMIIDLYENIYFEEENQLTGDELVEIYYDAYLNRLVPEEKVVGLSKIFDASEQERKNHMIDLEIRIRYTKCIRVLRMNDSDSLYTLHRLIQQIFEFDDDHLFEFCVGKGMLKKIYTIPEAVTSGEELSVTETSLGELELRTGQSFTYLFDFGDNWWFDIKVLKITEGMVERPVVLKAVNDPPQQYPIYEWEEGEGWSAEIDAGTDVSSILASIDDEFIDDEYAALNGLHKKLEKSPAEKRQEIERIVLAEPEKMLLFMTSEMRKLLLKLLQEEWIDNGDKCMVVRLSSFGFCRFSEEDEYIIQVPDAIKRVYMSKLKIGAEKDSFIDLAEIILRQCGVMETEQLYAAVTSFSKKTISYEEFEFMAYSRLHYFGEYYCDSYDGKEFMSRYERELTEAILEERRKPDNAIYNYPDFKNIELKKLEEQTKEKTKEQKKWEEYVSFYLDIDWQTEQWLIEQIPLRAAAGVFEKGELIAAYKEMIHKAGCRAMKKAEALIADLCETLPLATRKGNTAQMVQETMPVKGQEQTSEAEQEYRQLTLFDL